MTAAAFNQLPLLLRRGEVPELSEKSLRKLVEDGDVAIVRPTVHAVPPRGAGAHVFYVRSSLARVFGLEMDWTGFAEWPQLLFWGQLLEAGLTRDAVPKLLARGLLTARHKAHRQTRYHKEPLARMVGFAP